MPLQSVSRAFKDISLSFKRNPVTGDTLSLRNEDAIKRSVINLVRTKIGERFFNPILGSNVESYMFELADSTVETPIQVEIENVINNFEPRVRLREVSVTSFPEQNSVDVNIIYDIVGLAFPLQEISFVLQPTRY